MKILPRARFVDGRDNADLSVVSDILAEASFIEAARRVAAPDATLLAAYRHRIDDARHIMERFGVQGVPALMVDDENGGRMLPSNALFADFNNLATRLRAA